jgi:subtilisin family serine protease
MSVAADPRTKAGSMFDGRGCPDGTQCFLVDDRYAISSGTSMSAPVVAGAVALLLERRPELTQARATELLQAGARWPVGTIASLPPVGPGAVDLSYALDVLADEVPATFVPSPEASFVTLASARARPDRSWPIAGTIQLRRADGSIASGLDGSLLRVLIEGPGAVVSPPVKVAHGTFSFAVAGDEGAGGAEASGETRGGGRVHGRLGAGSRRSLPAGPPPRQRRARRR